MALRDGLANRAARSSDLQQRLVALPEYQSASLVAAFVGVRSEVETRPLLASRLAARQGTGVVFRTGGDLGVARILDLDELTEATFGLWEPRPEIASDPHRLCGATDVDLFLVPGLAFDLHGGRLGYGRGYYDRLLSQARPDAVFLAVAFECQMVPSVPMTTSDVPVHLIVTEDRVVRV
jgi:5-formyltetrahydrofolate cyclo-ligase